MVRSWRAPGFIVGLRVPDETAIWAAASAIQARRSAVQAGRLFSESVLLPFLLRALAEPDLDALRAEIAPHVKARARFFLAGLSNGGLGA